MKQNEIDELYMDDSLQNRLNICEDIIDQIRAIHPKLVKDIYNNTVLCYNKDELEYEDEEIYEKNIENGEEE